jgi:MFS family permease
MSVPFTPEIPDADPWPVLSIGQYELWMLAQAVLGFTVYGGVIFLIPLHVLAQGGTPGDTGAVVALIGLLGLVGPFVGGLADRFRAYRSLQLLSLVLVALGALAFAYAKADLEWLVAAGLVGMGTSGAVVLNTTFVVGSGLDHETQAKKLALLQLSLPAGQVLGLAVVAALATAGLSISGIFLAMAAATLVFTAVVYFVNGAAAGRVHAVALSKIVDYDEAPTSRVSLRTVLISQFGLSLTLTFLLMLSAEGIESQYASYMESVFGLAPELSATGLSIIMLITIPLYLVAGRWTARSGPKVPLVASAVMRALAGAGLLLLPKSAGWLALVIFGLIMVAFPFFELTAAVLASKTSPIGQGAGQGGSMAAYALGSIIGAVVGGWLAERYGFASLAGVAVVAAGAAAVLGLVFLKSPAQQAAEPVGSLPE